MRQALQLCPINHRTLHNLFIRSRSQHLRWHSHAEVLTAPQNLPTGGRRLWVANARVFPRFILYTDEQSPLLDGFTAPTANCFLKCKMFHLFSKSEHKSDNVLTWPRRRETGVRQHWSQRHVHSAPAERRLRGAEFSRRRGRISLPHAKWPKEVGCESQLSWHSHDEVGTRNNAALSQDLHKIFTAVECIQIRKWNSHQI